MKKINVEIQGLSPLLMNSPKSMIDDVGQKISKTTKVYDLKADADKLAYKKSNGELYIPAEAIKGSLINASSFKKIGKYAAKSIIAGSVHISPSEIGLGVKKYEVDARTVVIQKSRVVKGRPRIDKWKAKFTINYNEDMLGDAKIIKTILSEAGIRIGVLDFRPQKNGSFGMFEITKWEEQ